MYLYPLALCYFFQMYNPYTGQQFVQVYGVPAPVNSMAYPLGQPGQPGQPLPGGPGYMAFQNYQVPNQPLLQFGAPNVNGVAPGGLSSLQPSFPPGSFFGIRLYITLY